MEQELSFWAKVAIIVLAVLLAIGIVVGVMVWGSDVTSKNTDALMNTVSGIEERQYEAYNGTTVKGAVVLTAIRSYQNQSVGVYVITNGDRTGTNYCAEFDTSPTLSSGATEATVGSLTGGQNNNVSTATNKSLNTYINTSANFDSYLVKDQNGTIVGIYCVQQ